jgi:hypothetical protein
LEAGSGPLFRGSAAEPIAVRSIEPIVPQKPDPCEPAGGRPVKPYVLLKLDLRLPLREHLIQRFTILFLVEALARLRVGEQLRDLRQDFKVLLRGLLGNEQEDQ